MTYRNLFGLWILLFHFTRVKSTEQPSTNDKVLRKTKKKDTHAHVTSCLCGDDYKCLSNNTISENSEFQVCIMAPNNMKKVMVADIEFSQYGVVKSHRPKIDIIYMFHNTSSLDNIHSEISTIAVVRDRATSAFFQNPRPSPIDVHGVAKLLLTNNSNRN